MASFTGVGDTVTLNLPRAGEQASVAISGTYAMIIALQKEVGSPGSGAWRELKRWSTANATVAFTYNSVEHNENLRLIVLEDTSGTATATLTDASDAVLQAVKDPNGETVYEVKQSGVLFGTNKKVKGRLIKESVVLDQASYSAADMAELAGKRCILSRAGGIDITLPAATGSGDEYEFVVATASVDLYSIDAFASPTTGDINGVVVGVDGAAEFTWGAKSTENALALGNAGNTTGGLPGDRITLVDIAAGLWAASGFINHGTGTEATPFATNS